jgi:hypothetical protein
MMVTLTGAAVSDALEDAGVVSGVGGQYNFVAMAHELEEGRSVIALPATREKGGEVTSNIVWNYGHVTIPRHLRDVVATEYGVADLRGLADRDVIAAMLNLADSRFQPELLAAAKRAGKIEADYEIPAAFRENLPERVERQLLGHGEPAWFPHFPWQTAMPPEEAAVAVALGWLKGKAGRPGPTLRLLMRPLPSDAATRYAAELERMDLARPRGLKARIERRLLLTALVATGADGRPLTLPPRAQRDAGQR